MEHAWILHVAQTIISAIALWVVISKRMDARFQKRDDRIACLEEQVTQHYTDDARVQATQSQQILEIMQGRERREQVLADHAGSIVRLEAQREETMRLLLSIKDDVQRVAAKQETLMDTMASVMLKIGK